MKLQLLLLLCMLPVVTHTMEPKDGTQAGSETEVTDPNILGIRKLSKHISAIKKLINDCGKTSAIQEEIYEFFQGYNSDDVRPNNFWRMHQGNLEASSESTIEVKKIQQKAIAGQLALYELDLLNDPTTSTISEKINNAKKLLDRYKNEHITALENKKVIEQNHRY